MERKPQIKATLSDHVRLEVVRRAELNGTTPSQYLAAIAEWWFGQDSPAVSKAEERLLRSSEKLKQTAVGRRSE